MNAAFKCSVCLIHGFDHALVSEHSECLVVYAAYISTSHPSSPLSDFRYHVVTLFVKAVAITYVVLGIALNVPSVVS